MCQRLAIHFVCTESLTLVTYTYVDFKLFYPPTKHKMLAMNDAALIALFEVSKNIECYACWIHTRTLWVYRMVTAIGQKLRKDVLRIYHSIWLMYWSDSW